MKKFLGAHKRTHSSSAGVKFRKRALKLAGGLLAAVMCVGGLAAPAMAAGESVQVAISPSATQIQSGQLNGFTVEWTCSAGGTGGGAGTCEGMTIEVPVPDGMFEGSPISEPLTLQSVTPLNIGGTSYPGSGQVVTDANGERKIVWTFPAGVPVTGGVSGTVSFALGTVNAITPDQTTITPVATISSTNAGSATDDTTVTVLAEAAIEVKKEKHTPSGRPYLNENTTYRIFSGHPGQWQTSGDLLHSQSMSELCQTDGVWVAQNVTLVDTLPDGAEYVASSGGGVYDAGTHTVTWDLGDMAVLNEDGTLKECRDLDAVTVTVKFPDTPENRALIDDKAEVTNNVAIDGVKWGTGEPLTATAQDSHQLRIAGDGEFVLNKGHTFKDSHGFDGEFAEARYYFRERGAGFGTNIEGNLFSFNVALTGSENGHWEMTDMLPCTWTSPTDPNDTDCATPAFKDIFFGTHGNYFPAIDVHYTTNLGRTDVCAIPENPSWGSMKGCSNALLDEWGDPIGLPMNEGEWITKFWVDADIPALTDGRLFVHGVPSADIPMDNTAAVDAGVYDQNYDSEIWTNPGNSEYPTGITPSSQHPLWVTIENCTLNNTGTIGPDGSGGTFTTNGSAIVPDELGRCGYMRILGPQDHVEPVKRMYLPGATDKDQTPAIDPGATLVVDLDSVRLSWDGSAAEETAARHLPTFTDILPANLEFVEGSVDMSQTDAKERSVLGEPRVEVTTVSEGGEDLQKVVISFPDATDGGVKLDKHVRVTFQVNVKDGTVAGNYTNNFLTMPAENADAWLVCYDPGKMVDQTNWDPTTSWGAVGDDTPRTTDMGCQSPQQYIVLPKPGASVSKQVKGALDDEFIPAPGVGVTDSTGDLSYRIPVQNTGSIALRDLVVYDVLPRIGDTGITPGSTTGRGSDFAVNLTGPVTVTDDSGAVVAGVVQYSTADNPCRGELSGGAMDSAPAGCDPTWVTAPPDGDWSTVTAIRIDFGGTVFQPGDTMTTDFNAQTTGDDLTGVAWNNTARSAVRDSDGVAILPSEAPSVGIQRPGEISWEKINASDPAEYLGGSEWQVTGVTGDGETEPTTGVGAYDEHVADCEADTSAECTETDRDHNSGKFIVDDLRPGWYMLVETKAPAGYQLDSEPQWVQLTASEASFGQITNEQALIPGLPLTGGLGRDAFIIAALLLAAIAIAGITWRHHRGQRRTSRVQPQE